MWTAAHLLNLYESWPVFEFYIVDLIYIDAVSGAYGIVIVHVHPARMGK